MATLRIRYYDLDEDGAPRAGWYFWLLEHNKCSDGPYSRGPNQPYRTSKSCEVGGREHAREKGVEITEVEVV